MEGKLTTRIQGNNKKRKKRLNDCNDNDAFLLLFFIDHYKVLYDYDAQRNDELSLQVGDMVRILQSDNGEWCTAENLKTSQQGLVPTNVRTIKKNACGISF